jgi:uncharacterized SAM-binding protein YcdF (DUF218 family)
MQHYDVGIVLGHFYMGYGFTSRQKKRMEKAIELFAASRVSNIMTTGGKGMWKKTAPSMGEVARSYLIERGIEAERILVEDQSINTLQNACYALRLMRECGLTSALVITSVDHMPRARKIFGEMFPPFYQLDFVVSDYFCEFWSIIDFLWMIVGNVKYWAGHSHQSRAKI